MSQSLQTQKQLTFSTRRSFIELQFIEIGVGAILSQGPIFLANQTVSFCKFHTVVALTMVVSKYRNTIIPSIKILGGVPQSKNRTKGNFQMESLSYHFLFIRLPSIAIFPAIEPTFSRDIKITSLVESAVKYPSLKKSPRGQFSVGVYILSSSAYQTVLFCKFLCCSTKVRL